MPRRLPQNKLICHVSIVLASQLPFPIQGNGVGYRHLAPRNTTNKHLSLYLPCQTLQCSLKNISPLNSKVGERNSILKKKIKSYLSREQAKNFESEAEINYIRKYFPVAEKIWCDSHKIGRVNDFRRILSMSEIVVNIFRVSTACDMNSFLRHNPLIQ